MHRFQSLSSMSDLDRRHVLQLLASLAAAGAIGSTDARADDISDAWPKDAFADKGQDTVLKRLYGKTASMSDKIALDVPEIAENGAVVPVTVSTTLPGVKSISILIPENPATLICCYQLPPGTEPTISSRVKMAKTAAVIAVVEVGDQLLMASKNVKVTLGGCG